MDEKQEALFELSLFVQELEEHSLDIARKTGSEYHQGRKDLARLIRIKIAELDEDEFSHNLAESIVAVAVTSRLGRITESELKDARTLKVVKVNVVEPPKRRRG
jgi:Pyruvate/2-oxoacid:ferredoxin oxidoreductase gamma subunit